MKAAEILTALDLPAPARVERRIPKTLLLEHGAPTAADKRRINDGIDRVTWVAALKPTTVGVAAYRDDAREYLEIAVLHLTLRPAAKLARLGELIHRAVPYPVLAVAEQEDRTHLSLAHKRWSQGEAGKTVLDGPVVATEVCAAADKPHCPAFLVGLAIGRQPRSTLFALYQGWIDTLLALRAARRTGAFATPASAAGREARREALQECERLEAETTRLRAAAAKEKQIARRVEINKQLDQLRSNLTAALQRL
jgi:hypothetical protein